MEFLCTQMFHIATSIEKRRKTEALRQKIYGFPLQWGIFPGAWLLPTGMVNTNAIIRM